MDGEIVIGTRIDLKGIDKDIAKLEKRLDELTEKASKPFEMQFDFGNVAVTGSGELTADEEKELQDIGAQLDVLKAKKEEILNIDKMDADLIKKNNMEMEQFEQEMQNLFADNPLASQLTDLVKEYDKLSKKRIVDSDDIARATELKQQIRDIVLELEKTTGKKINIKGITDVKNEMPEIKKGIEDMGKGLKKLTHKAKQWALAIFGVRGAYMLIRNAMNVLTEGDEQLKADINYMKVALASALEPIIRGIVNLAKKLLMYIGYIIKAWTGINIFENANENLEKANGSAKELKKTITGFDEMNVLQDNSSSGGGNVAPSFDIESLGEGDIPGWVQWIADHGEEIATIIAGITGAILALKLGIEGVQALGVGIAIYGIIETFNDIKDFIENPSWEGFFKILADILIVVGGIMMVLTGNWLGLLIAGLGILIKLVIENWDSIKEILGKIWDWIYEHIIKPVVDGITNAWNWIKDTIGGVWDWITEKIGGFANWIKEKVIDPVSNFFSDLWDNVKNAFSNAWNFIVNAFSKGGKIFNGLKEGIVNTFKAIVNTLIKGINSIIKVPFDKINGLLNTIRNVKIPIINKKPFKGLWGQNPLPVPKIPKLAIGGIVNMPGRGVMVGNAIAGERGAEGVIPLTNTQQMELLGQAIGKYITINANITNSMNGRVISRELQKIQSENNFAYNR